MFEFGFARADITCFEPQMSLMGWGIRTNRAEGVAAPLYARAAMVRDPDSGSSVAFVVADILVIAQALRQGVVDALEGDYPELGLGERNVVLTATHTHSGPSGFAHYFWINISGPGYSQHVYDTVRDGIVEAIVAAHRRLRPGRLRFADGDVPASEGIAFNRSTSAYNRNEDLPPQRRERDGEPVDRRMSVLRFEEPDGRLAGIIDWFPLHGTCVHADNTQVHPDHKGVAATTFEASNGERPVFALFAQGPAGDMTSNYRYDKRRGVAIGRFDDDFANAELVGRVQARYAARLSDAATRNGTLSGPLQVAFRYVDFSRAPIEPRFAERDAPPTTRPARLGLASVAGTIEGPGPLGNAPWLGRTLCSAMRAIDVARGVLGRKRSWDPQYPMLDLGLGAGGRMLGAFKLRPFRFPALDPGLAWVKSLARSGAFGDEPWIAQVVPLHLVRLGSLAIAACPFELTTGAGQRLANTLAEELRPAGVEHVVINAYANAYAGYLTTFEEYQCQRYEGGYTLFGPFTLAALRTGFAETVRQLGATDAPLGPLPARIPLWRVERHAFREPWPD